MKESAGIYEGTGHALCSQHLTPCRRIVLPRSPGQSKLFSASTHARLGCIEEGCVGYAAEAEARGDVGLIRQGVG